MIDQSWYEKPRNDMPQRTSAGGVIARWDGTQWLIALAREQDYDDYVLPKGGVEKGETIEEAARREIAEEAGFTDLELVAKLGTLERLNFRKSKWMTIHVFLFRTAQTSSRPTDAGKHPNPAEWFPINHLPEKMFWPDQRELLESRGDEIVSLLEQHRKSEDT